VPDKPQEEKDLQQTAAQLAGELDMGEEKKKAIRAFEEIHEFDVLEQLKQFKGPFTKQGGYVNYHEWHSFFIGGGLIDLAFRLQEGAFIYFYLFVGIKVLKDTGKKCDGVKDFTGEIAKNFHYYIIAGMVAAVLWVELTNASVPTMTLGLADSLAALAA
jgi:hypothetical protein